MNCWGNIKLDKNERRWWKHHRRFVFWNCVMIERRKRKSIRLKNMTILQPGEYFVTICTLNHECMFGSIVSGR